MKFNVVIPKHALADVKKEFPHDNIIFFDNSIFEDYIQNTLNYEYDNIKFLLFKFLLMKKYKNLIFIDYPNVIIKPGLRKEILKLKTKDKLIFLNKDLDFFYSKACLKEIDDLLYKIKNIKDISYLNNFSLFMIPQSREYEFEKIDFYENLKYYIEFFLRKEKILLLNLKNESFDYKKYKKLLTNDTFLLGYNAINYENGKIFDSQNILLINFDVGHLPIRYDIIKTYINIETNKTYTGYFSEINYKGIL